MSVNEIDVVRDFNRVVTLRTGAIDGSYLGRGRPLGEARLLFEIGPEGADLRALRERLKLDSGYVSRLLRSLEREGLVTIEGDREDRRRRRVLLTATGKQEWAAYDGLSDGLAHSMLEPLSASQRVRLVSAMAEVKGLLSAASVEITAEAPDSDDAIACVSAYIAELAITFEEGFDPANGNPTPEVEALTPPNGCFLIASLDGQAIGCGALRTLEPGLGEIKRMWVSPQARGLGVAGRLLSALEEKGRELGMTRMRLDTNRALKDAQAMYRKSGYRDIERFNDNPYADFWFEKDFGAA